MEYDFTDDGRIVCRLGFTAHNFFDRAAIAGSRYGFRKNDGDVHPHIGCWRLDFDLSDPARNLGGPEANELKLVRRVHEQGKFRQDERPFPGDDKAAKDKTAREGKAKWVAKHFTTLRAESQQVKNSRGAPIAYDLVTTRTGTAEDLMPIAQAFGAKMDFVNYDFWVTRTPNEFKHYYQVPDFATGQALAGQRTTVWHSVPALHVPRDEDFAADGMNAAKGVALTEWIGFTLRPRNLFDGTPLFKTPGQ
jgi:Cu2+-containing amine oxidase